ncbi:MAG: GIY-YIG nuclease family protein [Bacteroidota bacterium]
MKVYVYILECSNGKYYTGSTKYLDERIIQHSNGEGANFTKKHLPIKLVYFEEYSRIDWAFFREKQIQGWGRKKKEALINGEFEKLPELSLNYKIDLNEDHQVAFDRLNQLDDELNSEYRKRTRVIQTLSSTGSETFE